MKRVIDGKIYNTATAEELFSWDNDLGCGDFGHCSFSVYKTKNGAYFIAGESGPQGRFSRSAGQNSWTGGFGIEVITEAEALELAESRNSDINADDVAEIFKSLIVEA